MDSRWGRFEMNGVDLLRNESVAERPDAPLRGAVPRPDDFNVPLPEEILKDFYQEFAEVDHRHENT